MTLLYAAVTDLPAAAVRERPAGAPPPPRLPALERLLARGEAAATPDWRRWALERVGLSAPAGDLPLGRLLAAAHGLGVAPEATLLVATPLRLGAGLTAVRVEAAGLALGAVAAADLAARFNAAWGGGGAVLHAVGGTLLLCERTALEVTTVDPALLAGGDLAAGLPRGRDAGALNRRMTEIQMWLHGMPPVPGAEGINSLWLWGAGRGGLSGAPAWPGRLPADPYLAAACRLHPGRVIAAELAHWPCAAPLAAAEERWFAPLAAALARGSVERAELHLGAHVVRLSRWQRLRWWRRPAPWWEFGA